MKRVLAAVLAAVMLIILCACGSSSVVGKWIFGVNTYEFREDNTVSISISSALNYEGTYEVDGDKIIITANTLLGEKTVELTYSLDGDTLKLEGDITFSGVVMQMEFAKEKK